MAIQFGMGLAQISTQTENERVPVIGLTMEAITLGRRRHDLINHQINSKQASSLNLDEERGVCRNMIETQFHYSSSSSHNPVPLSLCSYGWTESTKQVSNQYQLPHQPQEQHRSTLQFYITELKANPMFSVGNQVRRISGPTNWEKVVSDTKERGWKVTFTPAQ